MIVSLVCPVCKGGERDEVTISAVMEGSGPRDCDVLMMSECFNGCTLTDEQWAELEQKAIEEATCPS